MRLPALCFPICCQKHESNPPEKHPMYVSTSKNRISLVLLTGSEPQGEQQLGVMTQGCCRRSADLGAALRPSRENVPSALFHHRARKFTLKSQSHSLFSQFSLKWEKVSHYGWGEQLAPQLFTDLGLVQTGFY